MENRIGLVQFAIWTEDPRVLWPRWRHVVVMMVTTLADWAERLAVRAQVGLAVLPED